MIAFVVAHRLRSSVRAIAGAGAALGLVLGLALASFSTARTTASAYGRVLAQADAETAVVSHARSPEDAARVLDAMPEIARHRYNGGFLGFIAEVDRSFTGGVIAPAGDEFALEGPVLEEGRLPDPDAPDEVFANSWFADAGGLEVGQELTVNLVDPASGDLVEVPVTLVGTGIFPREAVVDDTVLTGILVPSRAFYEEHEDLRLYANSRIWLDDPGQISDLAQALSEEGFEVAEVREAERRGVEEALRPTTSVLIALGLLASLATVVLAAQVAQRRNERWRNDDAVLTALGAGRGARFSIHLVSIVGEVVLAVAIAIAVMLLVSPRAPIGPLHDLDPAQGVQLDATVALVGAVALAVALAVATLLLVFAGRAPVRSVDRPTRLTASAQRPTSLAGTSLALRGRRRSGLRLAVATTAGTVLFAAVATAVASARVVVDSPERYGVDFDVVAMNAFGDQRSESVEDVFGGPDVTDAASFTVVSLLVDGRTVPGLGITPLRGETGPTILEGDELRHDDEVVLGVDTAEQLGIDVGDEVAVQAATAFGGGQPPPARPLRVVGLATFAAIVQQGVDEARLGVGALVTRPTLEALSGSAENEPEWTVARLADGTDPEALIRANPAGIADDVGVSTTWFTRARPAELVQLDAASPVLIGAIAVSFLILASIVVQGSWSRTRASRADLLVLQALGCTGRQLARASTWQPVPAMVAALAVGLPLGIASGRLGFGGFARSIAVVDEPSTPIWLVGLLVLAVVVSAGLAALVAGGVARRTSRTGRLRDADARPT